MNQPANTVQRLVWDLPLRLFHWLLVGTLTGLWATAEVLDDAIQWHGYLGYFMLGLLVFRLIWGFVGPTYARFGSFLRGPKAIVGYLRDLTQNQHTPTTGHNPLGGVMVLVTLALLGTQAISGLFMTDDVIFNGPYYSAVSSDSQSVMSWLHHNVINGIWALVAVHIAAILFYQIRLRQNLMGPMFSGKKNVSEQQAIKHSRLLRAFVLVALISVLLYLIVVVWAPEEVIEDFYY